MDDKLLDKNLIISAVDNKLNHKNRKSQKDNLIYKNDHITIDVSRNFVDKQTLSRLFKLLKDIEIKKEITKLFSNKFKRSGTGQFSIQSNQAGPSETAHEAMHAVQNCRCSHDI